MGKLIVQICDFLVESSKKHFSEKPLLRDKLDLFIQKKKENPIAQYSKSDKANPTGTPMSLAVPKIAHAHLDGDISVFYTVSGSPSVLKLYAVLSHNEAGTGQPINNKRQKSVGKKMSNQEFWTI
jgi:hypothetical protein